MGVTLNANTIFFLTTENLESSYFIHLNGDMVEVMQGKEQRNFFAFEFVVSVIQRIIDPACLSNGRRNFEVFSFDFHLKTISATCGLGFPAC